MKNKSIFISRKISSDSPFNGLSQEYDVKIIDEPLIKITQVSFSYTPQTQWVFFSSKNAIKYFFAQNPDLSGNTKYAVISIASANYLKQFDKVASFVGEGVDLTVIAKKFRDVLQNDSVLFPQAMDSLQTIQKQLSFTNITYNLYTYKTVIKTDIDLPYADVVIFTSPSNVDSYFKKYRTDVRQLVIAMGYSTKHKLVGYGVKNVLTPNSFSEDGLLALLTSENGF